MGINSLEQLSDPIVSRIISFLPQNDKVNLLYTNYHFYVLVQPLLYRNLLFTRSAALSCRHTYDESLYTVIGGLKTPLATASLNNKISKTRQSVLLESLTINSELCKYVENIVFAGSYSNDGKVESFHDVISLDLFEYVMKNCPNLKNTSAFDLSSYNKNFTKQQTVQLDSLKDLGSIINSPIKHLSIRSQDNLIDFNGLDDNLILVFFGQLQTLEFNEDISQSILLDKLNSLSQNVSNDKEPLFHLQNLKVVFYHCFENYGEKLFSFLKRIDFKVLKRLEVAVGCDDMTCDCLQNFFHFLTKQDLKLQNLSFVQKTAHREHNYSEKFDFHITQFIKQYASRESLKFLSIRHAPPSDFNVGDGFEGNYLHRKALYEDVLPLLTNLETLICPTFLQSVAGYEQIISNLLWNGCECEHCNDYLPIFDKYILKHQYYDEEKSRMTDMISPILFGNVARVLSSRLPTGCDMFLDSFPPVCRYWDFHSAPYLITHSGECSIDKSASPPIAICVAHFLREYVDSIGLMIPTLRRCVLSGVFFDRIPVEGKDDNWVCSDQ